MYKRQNWYCSDVQVRGKYPFYAKRFWAENGVELAMEDGDLQDIACLLYTSRCV